MVRRFANPDPSHRPNDLKAVIRWGVVDRVLGRREIEAPGPPAPRVDPDLPSIHLRSGSPRLTWIGHASFVGTIDGTTFLIDPVFSSRVGWLVPRHSPPGLLADELPPVDALLVTHCHYDHLDRRSVLALARSVRVIVPLRLGRWFRRRGFRDVVELNWWQSANAGSLSITLVPSRHWSRRSVADVNHTLWGGFVIRGDGFAVYHGGDSAWFEGFKEIGRRFPGLAVAMLPVGSYAPAWFMENHHMNPEQAGAAFLDLGARDLLPMHWGCFKLTDEPLSEPVERMRRWWNGRSPGGKRLLVPAVGETVVFDE